MSGPLLRSGSLKDFHALGAVGNPVHSAASQLRAAMRRQLGPDVADLFAIPKQNQRGDTIDWYAPADGNVVPWTAATPEEREDAKAALKEAREQLAAKSVELQDKDQDSERKIFGRLLAQATNIPGDDHVYLVDGRPVMTFWGFTERGAQPGYDVIGNLDTGGRMAAAAAAPAPDADFSEDREPTPVPPLVVEERRRRPWWWWLLLIPLLLLLLALLLFLLQECGYYDVGKLFGLKPDPVVVEAGTIETPDPVAPVEVLEDSEGNPILDRDTLIERDGTGATTIIDRDATGVVRDRVIGGGTVRDGVVGDGVAGDGVVGGGVDGSGAVADGVTGDAAQPLQGELPGTDGEPPLAEDGVPLPEDAPMPPSEDPAADALTGEPPDLPADEAANTPGDEPVDEPVPPPGEIPDLGQPPQDAADGALPPPDISPPPADEALAPPPGTPPGSPQGAPPGSPGVPGAPGVAGAPAGSGAPLAIPPAASASGSTAFLDGQWRSATGLQDAQGRPMQLQYDFSNGGGTAKLQYQSASGPQTCTAPVQSRMQDGRLVIEGQQDFRCPDGRTFQRPTVQCEPGEQGRARCNGVNQDGSRYRVRIVK